jgi:hypothetical protein
MIDRKSVKIGHLSAHNLTLGMQRQIIDPDEDRGVFPARGAASFVGFPSFYMYPTKLPSFARCACRCKRSKSIASHTTKLTL